MRWEYKTITANGNDTTELNSLAREGWEVYAVTGGQPYVMQNEVSFAPIAYHLQRQKSTLAAPIPATKDAPTDSPKGVGREIRSRTDTHVPPSRGVFDSAAPGVASCPRGLSAARRPASL